MSKLTHKLNGKFVGATIGRPHFGEISKKENGITLIALIITIIVMLILTGVTLSITLGDNGLVNKAKEATLQTQIAMDRELLLSAVVGAIGEDGKVNLSAIVLPEGFTGSNGTYTSKNGHTFTVNENGEILFTGSDNVIENGGEEPVEFRWENLGFKNIDTNTDYVAEGGPALVFAANGNLKVIGDGEIMVEIDATNSDNVDENTGKLKSFPVVVEGMNAMGTISMNENEKDIDVTVVATVEGTEQTMGWICIKEEYDNETVYSNNEVLKMLGITNSTGTYAGTWTVLERNTDGKPTKLVSTRFLRWYVLGAEDPKAIGTNDFEKAVWSYKNAVNTLNTIAKETTGITTARSIKIEDIYDIIEENIDKGTDYGRVYNYYYNTETGTVCSKYKTGDNTWSEPYNTNYSSQTFINDNGETVVVDSAGDEVTLTHSYYYYNNLTDDQKAEIGILANDRYWLASTGVDCSSDDAGFRVRYMGNTFMDRYDVFNSSGSVDESRYGGVRAVVSLPGL